MKKLKGIRNPNWQVQTSRGDMKHSVEDIVSDVTTTYSAR